MADTLNKRDRAIILAEEYKKLESILPKARKHEIAKIRNRIALIAAEMRDLGYSLPALIQKRQERGANAHKK